MEKKKSRVAKRCLLLGLTSERGLSLPMEEMIAQRIKNSAPPEDHATREAEAERIIDIINSSKTEAEIVEKLNALNAQ